VPHRTIGGRSEPVAQAPFQGVERLGAGFGRFPAIVERAFRGDLPTLVMIDWVILTLTPWVKVRAMDNPLLPCVAVLDANREVLRVAPRRERHLWHPGRNDYRWPTSDAPRPAGALDTRPF
jgi:hypothetical protein